MHWLSTRDPECLTSANTRYKFSILTFPLLIKANKKALWAEWTAYNSSSNKTVYALVKGFVLSMGSLLYINSDKTWSTIFNNVYGSFLLGFIIWLPAAKVAECLPPPSVSNLIPAGIFDWLNWLGIKFTGRGSYRFCSSLDASLKKTFLRTSSFLRCDSSNFTLLN